MIPDKPRKGIRFYDSAPIHGWLCTVYRPRAVGGKRYETKTFALSKHGGRAEAYALAVAWVDRTERRLGKFQTPKRVHETPRSNTGVVGVSRFKDRDAVLCYWRDERGKNRTKYFSFGTEEPEKVIQRAARYRRAQQRAVASRMLGESGERLAGASART